MDAEVDHGEDDDDGSDDDQWCSVMMIGTVMMAMEADDGDKVEDDGDA